jgi:hypothetical protein
MQDAPPPAPENTSVQESTSAQKVYELPCLPPCSFATVEAPTFALNEFARVHNYAVVILRSVNNKAGVKRRVTYACDRHGSRRKYSPRPGTVRRLNASSRGCGCPMTVNLYRKLDGSGWEIRYAGNETKHNHRGSLYASSHPVLRRHDRPPAVEASFVTDAQTSVRPAQTLRRLVAENPDNATTVRDIYNARQRAERQLLAGRSEYRYPHADSYLTKFCIISLTP